MTMRAVWVEELGPVESASVKQVGIPEPGPKDVLIRTEAVDVNFPDILVMEGKYQVRPPLPFSPGKALAGVVDRVGSDVTGLAPGDRVAAIVDHGAYAEYAVADAAHCYPIPDEMPFSDAAAMGLSYQTAYFALLERGAFSAGERVLINGAAGGVGLAAVQLVKAMGGVAIAGVRTRDQAALVRSYGADHIVDLSAEPLRDSLREQIRDATGGHGVDIVLDPVGGAVFDASLRALDWCGRLVVIGFAAGELPTVRANYLLVKNISVLGLQWTDYLARFPQRVAAAQQHMYGLYQSGLIKPHIEAQYPLEDFKSALNLVTSGGMCGKTVLTLS